MDRSAGGCEGMSEVKGAEAEGGWVCIGSGCYAAHSKGGWLRKCGVAGTVSCI
jgi:hypothetical protein